MEEMMEGGRKRQREERIGRKGDAVEGRNRRERRNTRREVRRKGWRGRG